jgi:hypothetical protein
MFTLIVQPRTDLNFDSEAIWLEIVFPSYKMLLCVVYRQHNANYPFWDKFQQTVSHYPLSNISKLHMKTQDRSINN